MQNVISEHFTLRLLELTLAKNLFFFSNKRLKTLQSYFFSFSSFALFFLICLKTLIKRLLIFKIYKTTEGTIRLWSVSQKYAFVYVNFTNKHIYTKQQLR